MILPVLHWLKANVLFRSISMNQYLYIESSVGRRAKKSGHNGELLKL